jgi:acyl carrier protein
MSLTADEALSLMQGRLPYLTGVLRPTVRIAELGLDSLDLLELMMVADELFGVRLSVDDWKSMNTVGELAAQLAANAQEVPQP